MNAKVGTSGKQRIRESVWKSITEPWKSHGRFDQDLIVRMRPYFRDCYVEYDGNAPLYINVNKTCILEILKEHHLENIRQYMKKKQLPGAQIDIPDTGDATIQWFCWYDGLIFADGEPEKLTEDPSGTRNVYLDSESKNTLRQSFTDVQKTKSFEDMEDVLFKYLKLTIPQCYRNRYVHDVHPDITIIEMCFINVVNRNRGIILARDVREIKKSMNELLLPGVLLNYNGRHLKQICWFTSIDSKIFMALEIIGEEPTGTLNLVSDEDTKEIIRKSVLETHRDPSINTEKEYKLSIFKFLKEEGNYQNITMDQYEKGYFTDIIIKDVCSLNLRVRFKGIMMTKDIVLVKKEMFDLNVPVVQINFIDGDTAVLLWYGCSEGNIYIDVDVQGKDEKGSSLVDLI